MTPITFPRYSPNSRDLTINGERIVMWESAERGARIFLDNDESVLVGENSQAVTERIKEAFRGESK